MRPNGVRRGAGGWAQARAAVGELPQIHFAVITSQVIVSGANEFDHLGFSISDFGKVILFLFSLLKGTG